MSFIWKEARKLLDTSGASETCPPESEDRTLESESMTSVDKPLSSENLTKTIHVHSLPSDYADVQPKSYDPDFISDISNKMQVPEHLAMDDLPHSAWVDNPQVQDMNVPERIILADEGGVFAKRSILQHFHFDDNPSLDDANYVGLITPPRTLTLEERGFPHLEDREEEILKELAEDKIMVLAKHNGSALPLPVPYTPGRSPNDSLLLNEEDEATLLRTHLMKLTRRVAVMEQDSVRRAKREILLYPMVIGYFIFKLIGWFSRTR